MNFNKFRIFYIKNNLLKILFENEHQVQKVYDIPGDVSLAKRDTTNRKLDDTVNSARISSIDRYRCRPMRDKPLILLHRVDSVIPIISVDVVISISRLHLHRQKHSTTQLHTQSHNIYGCPWLPSVYGPRPLVMSCLQHSTAAAQFNQTSCIPC